MKSIINPNLILSAVFVFHFSIIFANNDGVPVKESNEFVNCHEATPALAAPKDPMILLTYLMPLTPCEASFDDNDADAFLMQKLAPVVPKEADFNDNGNLANDFIKLAPDTPAEAGFEDLK